MMFGEEMTLPVQLKTRNVDGWRNSMCKYQVEYVQGLKDSLNEMYDIEKQPVKIVNAKSIIITGMCML